MHLGDPVTQRVQDELSDLRVGCRWRVAAPGGVEVCATAIGKSVVPLVVDAAETKGGAFLIAFARMVVDHIKNHFEACGMQCANHCLEFRDLSAQAAGRRISGMWREVTE